MHAFHELFFRPKEKRFAIFSQRAVTCQAFCGYKDKLQGSVDAAFLSFLCIANLTSLLCLFISIAFEVGRPKITPMFSYLSLFRCGCADIPWICLPRLVETVIQTNGVDEE